MSNPPSSLQQRQRLHRRQNSTPVVAFEAMKVSTNMPPQRQNSHRRGQSFDQQQRSPIRKYHHGSTVSMTNLGQIHGQQILREAQQQKIARPGQQQHQTNTHLDLPISPECSIYTTSPNSIPATSYENMAMNAIMHQNAQGIDYSHSHQYFSDLNMSMQHIIPNMGLMDENNPQYLHAAHMVHSHADSEISLDARRMSQPDLRVQTSLRPHTPSHQIQTGKFNHLLSLFDSATLLTINSTISSHTTLQPAHSSNAILTVTPTIPCIAVAVPNTGDARTISSGDYRERGIQTRLHDNAYQCLVRDSRYACA